ncbi:acyltransferase [Elizabethkingia meningoseptica]|uniref:acyltransferase family protein n=1 Tax=Elizabethkingia meningoseptica TaxID=238 RepID=UPI000374CE05|nr:acyltransferase family protein [Elizabethkingia meningoseptica]AQX04960.1 acyltransferase [Elizabethkingia meningoseptica]AQX47001.1 acyltransferase [Elizabethkingia meningoseptica]KUY18022.1 acyltransferase [Elizabethkingia meningoseptica]OPB68289.1 acyltransferase [Elizabethkingia meningoseptica]OPC29074.1 acyltransferase [Elizabethkingia meningoseptica]
MNSYSFIAIIGILYLLSITYCRNKYFPFTVQASSSLKGILSILIILSHINFHADLPVFLTITHWSGTKVALFFFISGYGLMASYQKKEENYLNNFLSKRIWNIIKPLLLITILFLAFNYLDTGVWMSNIFSDLLIKGNTPLPYSWFAYAIIIFYLLFYIVFRFSWRKEIKILWMFILTFGVTVFLWKIGYDRAWWVSNLAFPLGMVYQYKEKIIINISRTKFGNLLLVPLCCFAALLIAILKIDILYSFAYVFIALMVIVLISYVKMPQSFPFIFLGKISYETYLVHGAVLTLLRGQHIYIANGYLYLLTAIIVTVLMSYILNSVFSRK